MLHDQISKSDNLFSITTNFRKWNPIFHYHAGFKVAGRLSRGFSIIFSSLQSLSLDGSRSASVINRKEKVQFLRQVCLCMHILPTIYDKYTGLAEPRITIFKKWKKASGSPNVRCCFAQRLVLPGSFRNILFRLLSGAISLKNGDSLHEEIRQKDHQHYEGHNKKKWSQWERYSVFLWKCIMYNTPTNFSLLKDHSNALQILNSCLYDKKIQKLKEIWKKKRK